MSEQLAGRDLAWLERRRAELFGLISQVGDFRRGALNAVWRKCGKPNCACAQPGHRGHGPQHNLTRRMGGKTVNVHLKPGPELEKVRREVAEHQRFADLVAAESTRRDQHLLVERVLATDLGQRRDEPGERLVFGPEGQNGLYGHGTPHSGRTSDVFEPGVPRCVTRPVESCRIARTNTVRAERNEFGKRAADDGQQALVSNSVRRSRSERGGPVYELATPGS